MTNGTNRIDFDLVKASVSMEMLIVHLGLFQVQRKGAEVRLKCPFHNGKSDNSMLVNLANNTFYCFGCRRRGGVIDFVAYYEDCTFFDAATLLEEWFAIKAANEKGRQAAETFISDSNSAPQITAQHLIASIELQLAQLKQLLISR